MRRYFLYSTIITILLTWSIGCAPSIALPPQSSAEPTAVATAAPGGEPTIGPTSSSTDAATADATGATSFDYLVRVVDSQDRPISAARILIEMVGQAPLGNFSDNDGYGRVAVPASHAGQPGRVVIEADGYRAFRQEIDLYAEQLPQLVRLAELLPTTVESALPTTEPEVTEQNVSDLYVLTEDDRFSTWYISGPAINDFDTGDFLIVYSEIVPGTEIAIAQLRVVAENPTSLLAQTMLINPTQKVRSGLRVDGNLAMLATSELVPAQEFAVGYLLEAGRVRLRLNSGVVPDMVLQAYEAQMVGERISDYLPFSPPLTMRVTQVGISGVIAQVVLEDGVAWPQAGTLVSDLGIVPTPTATSTASPEPPTAVPSSTPVATAIVPLVPTPLPTPFPTATPAPVVCQNTVDPELAVYWVQVEMGCPVGGSTITWASYTPYQTGLMVWRRDTNAAYGFFNSGSWLAVADVWDGSAPTPSRGDPPPGYREPIRGTGYVWGTDDRFFNGLGWAADEQKGFCAKVQTFEQGFILRSSTVSACHEENLFNHAAQGGFELTYLTAHNSGYWRQ